jgi:hypothetical protein
MVGPNLSLDVVGADFPNASGGHRRYEILLCERGEVIHLLPEPGNPADPQSVVVYSARGIQIGYLRADRAPWIGGMLRLGRDIRAVFHDKRPWGATIRLNLDGHEPTMPDPQPEAPAVAGVRQMRQPIGEGVDPDPGFWPDEIPPDE